VETEEGKVETSVSHVAPGEGSKSLRVFGELVTYKITSCQTGGAYSLFEVVTEPGSGPPPHVQHREDEAFYVLKGEYEFLVEDRTITAGAGSLIYVPKGNLHAHINVGEGTAGMLVSQTPGGLHERFFEDVGEPATDESRRPGFAGPLDMRKIAAIAAEYGIEMPAPRGGEVGLGASSRPPSKPREGRDEKENESA
jgi:quercetin dioxygenase-like cupin family protein